jgi:hypothetical protein
MILLIQMNGLRAKTTLGTEIFKLCFIDLI